MKLGLYLSFLLCAWQSYQVVVGFNIPLSRSSLDGLSRDALIELILGKSNSENKSSESVAIASAEKHHVSHISTPPPPKSPLLPLGDNMTSALPPLSSVVTNEKFYIYPLDKKFWWRWPRQNSSCTAHNQVGHNHAMNSGLGNPSDVDSGMMNTWHFSMFSSVFNRLKRSSRRTMNPDEAALFFIPYDMGLDGNFRANCDKVKRCTPGYADEVMNFLREQKYFARHKGADHVVMWSLGHYHPWPKNGCNVLMSEFCINCAVTCYWMDPVKKDNHFISMPFPSSYHSSDAMVDIPWKYQNTKYARNITALYLGSTKTLNPDHTKIRRSMTAQCKAHPKCEWLQIAHSSTDSTISKFVQFYRRSVFCLCPPGDDPGRKALFDIILSGCIPVIFNPSTIYNQYPYHIGEKDARDISVNIPGRSVRFNKVQLMDLLLSIPPEVIRQKQQALERVAPRIQYAMPPLHLLANISDETRWDPPFPDAVDMAINGLTRRAELLKNKQPTGIPETLMTLGDWNTKYGTFIYN